LRIASYAWAASQCNLPYGLIERSKYAGTSPGLTFAKSAGSRTGLTGLFTCGRTACL